MGQKAPYRNSIRTQKMIKLSFLKLVSTKDISKIKILELTELADISKGTFYTHYQDIYAVLEDIENENINKMITFLEQQPCHNLLEDFTPLLMDIFSQINVKYESYSMLFKSSCAHTFLKKLQKVFVDYMMNDKELLSKIKSTNRAKIFLSFIAVGTANLIYEWFNDDMNLTFESVAILLNGCIINGVNTILK